MTEHISTTPNAIKTHEASKTQKIHLKVAAGIVLNQEKTKVFLTKRPKAKSHGGLWEFPGGKFELGETGVDALIRELDEEIGIQLSDAQLFMAFEHDYPETKIAFEFYLVNDFLGEPFGKEGQLGQWFLLNELTQLNFPKANNTVVEQLEQSDFNPQNN